MSARSSLSFGGFARKRPPVPGYLYHGSPDGDITLDERRISWEPFYATDCYEAALHFATDGHRRPGTINYVRPLGPFWTLMENDVADELGPFTSYIFARRGSVRIAPLSEAYRDYLQDRIAPGERDSRLPEGRELSDYPTPMKIQAMIRSADAT